MSQVQGLQGGLAGSLETQDSSSGMGRTFLEQSWGGEQVFSGFAHLLALGAPLSAFFPQLESQPWGAHLNAHARLLCLGVQRWQRGRCSAATCLWLLPADPSLRTFPHRTPGLAGSCSCFKTQPKCTSWGISAPAPGTSTVESTPLVMCHVWLRAKPRCTHVL